MEERAGERRSIFVEDSPLPTRSSRGEGADSVSAISLLPSHSPLRAECQRPSPARAVHRHRSHHYQRAGIPAPAGARASRRQTVQHHSCQRRGLAGRHRPGDARERGALVCGYAGLHSTGEGPGTAQADLYSLGRVLYELSTGNDGLQFPQLPLELIQCSLSWPNLAWPKLALSPTFARLHPGNKHERRPVT